MSQESIDRAERARELMDDLVMLRVFSDLDAVALEASDNSAPHEEEFREYIHRYRRALTDVKATMKKYISDGRVDARVLVTMREGAPQWH